MAHVKLILLVLLCGKTFVSVNSMSNIIPESITSCEDAPKLIDLTTVGEGKDRSWTGEVNVPFQIDSNTEFTMDFHWYKNNEVEKTGKIFKGKACFYIQKFGANVWKQIKNAAKPPINDDCTVNPGKYEFVDFVPELGDLFLPMGGSGRANTKLTITKDGNVFCAIIIADLK